jgi:hypothetical protein
MAAAAITMASRGSFSIARRRSLSGSTSRSPEASDTRPSGQKSTSSNTNGSVTSIGFDRSPSARKITTGAKRRQRAGPSA